MVIDFEKIPHQTIEHMKGGELSVDACIFDAPEIRIIKGRLIPGSSIGLHRHEPNSETIYILEGHGKAICDGEVEPLKPGSCSYCKKGHEHTLINDSDEDLVFFGVIPIQP